MEILGFVLFIWAIIMVFDSDHPGVIDKIFSIIGDVLTWSPVGVIAFIVLFALWPESKDKQAKPAERSNQDKATDSLSEMNELCNDALLNFELFGNHIIAAHRKLDLAEREFTETAYGPFWQAIEEATTNCYMANIRIGDLRTITMRYNSAASNADHFGWTFPRYPISKKSMERLNDIQVVRKRMAGIVRKAQCNFKFAMIYEQIQTRRGILAGFEGLRDAIESMSSRLEKSFNLLANETAYMRREWSDIEAMKNITVNVQSDPQFLKLERERANREKEIVKMLDNIQYKRTPPMF